MEEYIPLSLLEQDVFPPGYYAPYGPWGGPWAYDPHAHFGYYDDHDVDRGIYFTGYRGGNTDSTHLGEKIEKLENFFLFSPSFFQVFRPYSQFFMQILV